MTGSRSPGTPVPDAIESEVWIDAAIEHVWSLVSRPGFWVGDGLRFDLNGGPGETVIAETERYGTFPVEIVALNPPYTATYRWASAFPGEHPVEGTATTIRFMLEPINGGVRVRVRESGFASLKGGEDFRLGKYRDNVGGWAKQLDALKAAAESDRS
jgi:uncharacterized protein YndB with AHSA1/START domain